MHVRSSIVLGQGTVDIYFYSMKIKNYIKKQQKKTQMVENNTPHSISSHLSKILLEMRPVFTPKKTC